jgi:hypothetical protein
MEHRRASKTTLSPVPPVLSGADQARFSPPLSSLFSLFFAAKQQLLLHLVRSPGASHQRAPEVMMR